MHVPGWPVRTTQAGDALRDILDEMGATVHLDRTGLTVSGSGRPSGIDVDLHDASELTPVVAALCAMATALTHPRSGAFAATRRIDWPR